MPMLRLLLPLALPACATGDTNWAEREQTALDAELATRVAGESRSCVYANPTSSLVVRARTNFVYHDGRTIWLSRPIHGCAGFRPDSTLLVELRGSQYCRGDRVRGLDPGSAIPGPLCVLGDWTPYRRP